MSERLPFAIAFDQMNLPVMAQLARRVGKRVHAIKVHQPVVGHGAVMMVNFLRESGADGVWIDLKSHDIPRTVEGEVLEMKKAGATIATVHASGDIDMMKAAVSTGLEIYGITLLTSLENSRVRRLYGKDRNDVVRLLALDAKEAGCHGVVCSAREVGMLASMELGLKLVVPGTRSAGVAAKDQKNVELPARAIEDGATILVLGSQVIASADPEAEIDRVWTEEVKPALDRRAAAVQS